MADFSTRLRELRERRHLSKRKLAKRARLSEETVDNLEAGSTIPQAVHVVRLAKALKVAPGDLSPGHISQEELARARASEVWISEVKRDIRSKALAQEKKKRVIARLSDSGQGV